MKIGDQDTHPTLCNNFKKECEMTQPIDAVQMARDAGFPFNKYGLLQGDEDGEIEAEEMFARLTAVVLERAAVECEQSEAYRGSMFAQRIRALKPVTDKEEK